MYISNTSRLHINIPTDMLAPTHICIIAPKYVYLNDQTIKTTKMQANTTNSHI